MKKVNDDIVVKGTGNKKGNVAYSKWRNKQLANIEELNEDDNVFSRLKRSKNKNKNTLFDKLKFHSKSK